MPDPAGPILLYDGVCGLCDRTVRLVLRFDAEHRLRFAPLQGEFARELRARHQALDRVDSLVLVESSAAGERVFVRSDAMIRLARHLGGAWRLVKVLRLVPAPLRDRVYDLIARNRYRWFGRYERCPIPPPEVRYRFLP